MSTLTVTNIQATGETASRAVSGVAAAWVNFNGTGAIAIRDSLNVSSLTDAGTGNYGQTFTSAFANANFNATLGAGITSTGASIMNYGCGDHSSPRTTTTFRFYYFTSTGTSFADTRNIDTTMQGDLA